MKILQVVHQFLPRHLGGTEIYTYELSRVLNAHHEVTVFCAERGRTGTEEPSVEVSQLDSLPVITVHRPLTGLAGTPPGFILGSYRSRLVERSFTEHLDRVRPDIVHFQHLFGLSCALPRIARARGIPTLLTLQDYWFMCSNIQLFKPDGQTCNGSWGWSCAQCMGIYKRRWLAPAQPALALFFLLRNQYVRQALSDIDFFVAPSHFLLERFRRWCGDRKPMLYLEYGIDTPSFGQGGRQEQAAGLRVAYLGGILPHKGVHILIEALRQVQSPNIELYIYGDLSTFPRYGERIARSSAGLPIHLEGRVARDRVPEVLASADVLVVPSLWYENSPLVIQEALASGVPVLVADGGAMVEKIRPDVDGLVFRRGDAGDLAAKLDSLARDPSLLRRLKDNIRPPQSIGDGAQKLEGIYQGLVEESR
jgi:glycosyltransferase involved in cell wall biosynthesis